MEHTVVSQESLSPEIVKLTCSCGYWQQVKAWEVGYSSSWRGHVARVEDSQKAVQE